MGNSRAKQGGQTGVNGDFYKGGQFLPSSKNTVKGSLAKGNALNKRVAKVEIAPKVWVESKEAEGLSSIYKLIDTPTQWQKGQWQKQLEIIESQVALSYLGFEGERLDTLKVLVEKWNNGERFTSLKI